MGSVGLIGLRAEVPFFRGTLDWLGIKPSFGRREEYKTATNSLTETAMTGPQREETEALLNSMSGQIVRGIAAARQLPETQVGELIDRGPLLADEAKAAGLIDRIGYRDEAVAEARGRAGSGARLMPLSRYREAAGRAHASGPKIALIYGTGLIVQGGADDDLLPGGETMSARKSHAPSATAAGDPDVRAILFRIDSPGGSAVASETIWREVARARERGKPVIVSMGDVAGSGGYYIAAPADKIVAQPATLTGSIGVLAGKLVVTGLLDKLGAASEAVQRGANAAMFSPFEDFSPAGAGPARRLSRRDLSRLQGAGRGRPAHERGPGRGGRQGPRLVGRGRQGAGAGGRARRLRCRAATRQGSSSLSRPTRRSNSPYSRGRKARSSGSSDRVAGRDGDAGGAVSDPDDRIQACRAEHHA